MNARDKLDAARLKVYKRHPYCSAVLLALRPVEKAIGTLGVDADWRLYYDPTLEWSLDELAAVVWHEVNHVLRDHAGRRQDRKPGPWNVAGDAEINPDIINAGWKLPGRPVMPKTAGLLAEAYYKDVKVVEVCCGGCAGNPAPWEDGKADGADGKDGEEGKDGTVPAVSKLEQETLRRQAAEAISAAGDAPAGLRQWAAEHLKPAKVDWRRQLRRMFSNAIADAMGAVDFSWRKPSRRGAGALPCIVPALRAPKLDVGVILDASGSMMGGPAEAARSEVLGIVKSFGECTVHVADTRIAETRRVGSSRDVALLGETLGGTDMRAAVLEVQAKGKHTVLVLLTDGETGWPSPGEVRVPFVVAVTPGGESPPSYIRSVRCDGKAD